MSVVLNTLHQLLTYEVKDRLTFEISSREHPHQELVMHKYILLKEGVTKNTEILQELLLQAEKINSLSSPANDISEFIGNDSVILDNISFVKIKDADMIGSMRIKTFTS